MLLFQNKRKINAEILMAPEATLHSFFFFFCYTYKFFLLLYKRTQSIDGKIRLIVSTSLITEWLLQFM
jgi:hypothetical protein